MNSDIVKQLGNDAIGDLVRNQNVCWFVDANVLIGGAATKLFDDPSRVYVLEKVKLEVRKRPENIVGNQFLDAVEKIRNILPEDWYPQEFSGSVHFLISCAKKLAPAIRANIQWFKDSEGLDTSVAESRAIERAEIEGDFLKCDFNTISGESSISSEIETKINAFTRKSWIQYPNKRRAKIAEDEYQFTDELLVATAIAHSILKNEKVCILSNDKDITAIMKQVSDNWIWSASAVECQPSQGEATFDEVAVLFEKRCQELNLFRRSCVDRNKMRINEGVNDPALMLEPFQNEVILCRPEGQLERFGFNQQMVDYARNINSIQTRYNLISKGLA